MTVWLVRTIIRSLLLCSYQTSLSLPAWIIRFTTCYGNLENGNSQSQFLSGNHSRIPSVSHFLSQGGETKYSNLESKRSGWCTVFTVQEINLWTHSPSDRWVANKSLWITAIAKDIHNHLRYLPTFIHLACQDSTMLTLRYMAF